MSVFFSSLAVTLLLGLLVMGLRGRLRVSSKCLCEVFWLLTQRFLLGELQSTKYHNTISIHVIVHNIYSRATHM